MSVKSYSSEKNIQILIALMKGHGIRKVIVSPGTTNFTFVGSLQNDSFFELYSSVDERSAAYLACGLAYESGEPVALSCTGATASRNYAPGLTEAFYRKIPVLAVTSTQHTGRIGNMIPQVIDRSSPMKDMVKYSVQIPTVHDAEDEWACEIAVNKALLELTHRGGGPVHINLTTTYSLDFSVSKLPKVRVVRRFHTNDMLPPLRPGRVGVLIGVHAKWDQKTQDLIDDFCAAYDAVVLSDHANNYRGKYRVLPALVCAQENYYASSRRFDTLIHLGGISSANLSFDVKHVWRVCPDGEVCDAFRKLQFVFEMEEYQFFEKYVLAANKNVTDKKKLHFSNFFKEWQIENKKVESRIPELPFSNAWIAHNTISKLPDNCVLHLGVSNTRRVWNFFESPSTVQCSANTGAFGIDGIVSTFIGASLYKKDKIYFCIVGDLAFFYDLNVIGNNNIANNVRIMIINNGMGGEFRIYNHKCNIFNDKANKYMAAAGHFGNKSFDVVKNFTQNLGFEYLSASNKQEFYVGLNRFVTPNFTEKPMVFEVFVNVTEESCALRILNTLIPASSAKKKKEFVLRILGPSGINIAKKILGVKGVNTVKKLLTND